MNNTFPLEQNSKTGCLDFNLLIWQYNLDLMSCFMEILAINPNLTKNLIAKKLGDLILHQNAIERILKMKSPYRSSDLKKTQKTAKKICYRSC